jgi:hypothetical protein
MSAGPIIDETGKTIIVLHERRQRPDDLLAGDGPLGNQEWVLASMAIDYIAEVRGLSGPLAALELRNAMFRGEIEACHGTRRIEPEFWRFNAPDVRGFVNRDLWIEVCAAQVLAAFPRRPQALSAPQDDASKSVEAPVSPAAEETAPASAAAPNDPQPAERQKRGRYQKLVSSYVRAQLTPVALERLTADETWARFKEYAREKWPGHELPANERAAIRYTGRIRAEVLAAAKAAAEISAPKNA